MCWIIKCRGGVFVSCSKLDLRSCKEEIFENGLPGNMKNVLSINESLQFYISAQAELPFFFFRSFFTMYLNFYEN